MGITRKPTKDTQDLLEKRLEIYDKAKAAGKTSADAFDEAVAYTRLHLFRDRKKAK